MQLVHLHYWAGARAAAGMVEETVSAATVEDALRQVSDRRANPHFERVIRASTLLIDEVPAREADLSRTLVRPVRVEILPPFAGGERSISFDLQPIRARL
ncbi:MAG TPA: MoaD/ThiS family protein [Propionibacteriaceae bacterium]